MSTSNMDHLFSMSSGWQYCSTSEIRFWRDQDARSGGVPELIDAPQAEITSLVDLASLSSSPTSSGPIPRSSDRPASYSLGRTSSGITDLVNEVGVALVHPGSLSIDQYSGCSSISYSHIPMHESTSLSVPSYASTVVSSPKTFEPEGPFPTDGDPYCEGFVPTDQSWYSTTTLSYCQQPAREDLHQLTAPGVSGKEPRTIPGAPHTLTSRASTSENESPIVCQSCQRIFARKTSLSRHRKEICGNESEKWRFQCNPRLHYGCTERFKRRCSLKGHYMKLGFTREQAVVKVREQYPKGAHRRRV